MTVISVTWVTELSLVYFLLCPTRAYLGWCDHSGIFRDAIAWLVPIYAGAVKSLCAVSSFLT